MNDRVIVGSLAGAFGVNGEVRLKSFCAVPEAIALYTPLYSEAGEAFHTITLTAQLTNALVARIDGITTKEQADALRGQALYADRDRLPSLPDDEFYHADLIGMQVYDTGGTLLGSVKGVENHGAGDLLEINAPGAKDTVLLPFTQAIVPTVDLASRRIVADPPDGVFGDA